MKKQTVIALVAAFAAVAAVSVRSDQSPQKRIPKHDYVVLQATPYQWQMGSQTPNGWEYTYQWGGFSVYNYDASEFAPKMYLPVGTNYAAYITTNQLAQTLADLEDQGFDVVRSDGYNYTLRRVR